MRNIILLLILVVTVYSARNRTENTPELSEPEVTIIAKPHPSPSPPSKHHSLQKESTSIKQPEDDDNEEDSSQLDNEDDNEEFNNQDDDSGLLNSQPSSRTHVSTSYASVFHHCSWPGQKSKPIPFTLAMKRRHSDEPNKTAAGAYASWVKVKGLSSKGAFVRLETLSYLFADIQFYFLDAKGRDINSADLGVASSLTQAGRDDILSRWFLQLMKRTVKGGSKRPFSSTDANIFFRSLFRSLSISRLIDPIGIFQHKAVKHFVKMPYILLRELFEGFGAEGIFDFVYDSIVLSAEKTFEFIAYWVSVINGSFDSSLYASSSDDSSMNNKASSSSFNRASPAFLLNPFESLSFIVVRRVNATSGEPAAQLLSPTGFRCQVNPLAFRYPIYLFAGLVLFDNAESLVTNTYALYAGGFAFSITIVLVVLLFFLYRSSNDRRVVLPTIAALMYGSFAGQAGNQYDPISLLRYLGFDEVADVVSEYYPVLLLLFIWVVALLLISFKNVLPFDRNFVMNSLTYGLKILGLWLTLNSSNVMSLGVIVIFLYVMYKTGKFILTNGVAGFISSPPVVVNSDAGNDHIDRDGDAHHLRRPSSMTKQARTPVVQRDTNMSPAPAPLSSGIFSFFRSTPSPSAINNGRSLAIPGRPSLGGGAGRPIFSGGRGIGLRDPSPSGHSLSSYTQLTSQSNSAPLRQQSGHARRGSPSPAGRASAVMEETIYGTNVAENIIEEYEGEGQGDWIPEDGNGHYDGGSGEGVEEQLDQDVYEDEDLRDDDGGGRGGESATMRRRRGSFVNISGRY